MVCGAPNPGLGTAHRYIEWFDCTSKSLGQDGFLGLASYVTQSGILTGVLTIMIALIGYRLLLGGRVDIADGTNWAIRIGVVLAVLTGWSAFQTVFYDLAISGPIDLSGRLASSTGVPSAENAMRYQSVYDALRLGLEGSAATNAAGDTIASQPSLPLSAVMFLLVCVGTLGSAKLAAGFLLAVAPIVFLALLAGPTTGLFVGWLRALATVILATAGLALNSLWCLLAMESEIARMQGLGSIWPGALDEQAPISALMIFFLVALAIVFLSAKIANGIAERIWESGAFRAHQRPSAAQEHHHIPSVAHSTQSVDRHSSRSGSSAPSAPRATQIAQAFQTTAQGEAADRHRTIGQTDPRDKTSSRSRPSDGGLNISRNALGRRHRSARKRDQLR